MTEELLSAYTKSIASVSLVPSSGGRFEVSIDGDVVFSKAATGRFPDGGEIRDALATRLRA